MGDAPKTKRKLGFLGGNFLVVSIIVHLLFGVAATIWVVQTIQAKRKLTFQGGPSSPNPSTRALEHTVQMAKKKNTMSAPAQAKRITTTGIAKVALPDMPTMPSLNEVAPMKMAGMGGSGLGFGGGGGGGGTGGGGKGSSLFGFRQMTGGSLVGRFFDLKQKKDGKPSGVDNLKYSDIVTSFVKGGWHESTFRDFFQAPNPLYATQIMTPQIDAAQGPSAFGVDVKPSLWLVHYEGKVSPPESGRYAFVGSGDDVMIVRFNGRVVLDRCWEMQVQQRKPFCRATENYDYGWITIPNGQAKGETFEASAGSFYNIDILIGEQPGGWSSFCLLYEKADATYQKDARGNPILPVFRVSQQKLLPLPPGQTYVPHMEDGPVWKAQDISKTTGIPALMPP